MVDHGRRALARCLAVLLVLAGMVVLQSEPAPVSAASKAQVSQAAMVSQVNVVQMQVRSAKDDYPDKWRNVAIDSVFDDWLHYNRECVSWVSWRLHASNGFEMPFNDHAGQWGSRAQALGYKVDMQPAIGAVAWWGPNASSSYGHVAWVESISANGQTVHILEYNNPAGSGNFNERDIPVGSVSGYIHFKDMFGGIPDGQVVRNLDISGFYYVAAGGSLFWYNGGANATLHAEFVSQMKQKLGNDRLIRDMYDEEIRRIEANYPYARTHPPRDNTLLIDKANNGWYVMQYGYAWHLGSMDEIAYLGLNQASVIVLPSGSVKGSSTTTALLAPPGSVASPPLGTILQTQTVNDPDYEYQRDQYGTVELLWANNHTAQDCIRVAKGGAAQRVPQAMVNQFLSAGTYQGNKTTCAFNEQVVYYGPGGAERWQITGNNTPVAPYARRMYASTLAIHCYRGPAPTLVGISVDGVNGPALGAQIHCPNNTYLKNNQTGQVFQWWDGQLHYISSQEMLSCLTQGNTGVVIPLPEAAFGGAPQGAPAQCQFEGKLLQAPNGQVFWVKDGARRYVGNAQILNCLTVRANAGVPVPVPVETVNSYTLGAGAYCTYPADIRFVRGDGQAEVWRVFTNGTRQHAGSLCSPQSDPRYAVHVVPAGEVDGHQHIGMFDATPSACAAIP